MGQRVEYGWLENIEGQRKVNFIKDSRSNHCSSVRRGMSSPGLHNNYNNNNNIIYFKIFFLLYGECFRGSKPG